MSQEVPFTGGNYSENFDSMGLADPAQTPLGWYVGPAPDGIGVILTKSVPTYDDVDANWGHGNFGLSGSTERALGSWASRNAGGDLNMEVRIRNNTGAPIGSFKVLYDGEQWRANGAATELPQGLVMTFGTNGVDFVAIGDAFNFLSPINPIVDTELGLNGNLPENRVGGIGGVYAPATQILPGEVIYLRWWDRNNSGFDQVLAIDNFRFSLSPSQPVMILAQPEDQFPVQGRTATFRVKASGTNPQFQWFKEGVGPIAGATTDTLTIPKASHPADNGRYYVEVSNPAGILPSRHALLSITLDQSPPGLVSAVANRDLLTITASFSEPIGAASFDPTGAGFQVSPLTGGDPLPLLSATLSNESNIVLRLAAPRNASENYRLQVTQGVADVYQNPLPAGSQIAIASEVVLIAIDSKTKWRFDQTGHDLGTAWRDPSFPDSTWPEGSAPFDGKMPQPPGRSFVSGEMVRTQLTLTNQLYPNSDIATYYFRSHFSFPGDPATSRLRLRTFIDDSAIWYVNGQEAGRLRLAAGPIGFDHYSGQTVEAASFEGPFDLPLGQVVAGDNVMAVEVHNGVSDSSDITFGLELIATIPTLKALQRPTVSIDRSGDTLVISWTEPSAVLKASDSPTGPWTPASGGTFDGLSYRITPSSAQVRFFLLVVP